MRKIIRNIKYWLFFYKSSKKLEDLIKQNFINDFKIPNPKIKVSFRFGYAKDFHRPIIWDGTKQIGVIREDYQHGCLVSSFLTLNEYFKMNIELKNKK